ncbi:type II toxin-antitoxin system antitoxin SocA domain-containing protein [Atopobiaceae bacterium 24-176]
MAGATTAVNLANAIVDRHGVSGFVTNMKLNKLVYFAYAFFLKDGGRLFDDDIEAWQYGPVVPAVYHAYKSNGSKRITEPVSSDYDAIAAKAADVVWNLYGHLTAYDLMRLSHKEGGAWKNAVDRRGLHSPIFDTDVVSSIDASPEGLAGMTTISSSVSDSMDRWAVAMEMLKDS